MPRTFRRAALSLALVLSLPVLSSWAGLSLPTNGLPEGRLGAPLLTITAAPGESWRALRDLSPELWKGLDEASGPLAAGLVLNQLPKGFLERLSGPQADALRQGLRAELEAAYARAAEDVDTRVEDALFALEQRLGEGRVGLDDLSMLAGQLRALSVYGGQAKSGLEEVSRALDGELRRLKVSEGMARTAQSLGKSAEESAPVSAPASPRKDRLGRLATHAGYGLLGASTVLTFNGGPVLGDVGPVSGLMTWGAIGLAAAGKFLQNPAGLRAAPPAAPVSASPESGWLARRFPGFAAIGRKARNYLENHGRWEAAVGAGSWTAFKGWLSSGIKTALAWFPLSLLGMVGGALLAWPLKFLVPGAVASQSMPVDQITRTSFLHFLNGYLVLCIIQELVVLGVGFNLLRRLSTRLLDESRATLAAGAATLLLYVPFMCALGFPINLALTMLGIEAVLVYLYARSGTLLIPVALRFLVSLMALESARMQAWIKVPAVGELAGLPAWTGAMVTGLGAGLVAAWAVVKHHKSHGWGFLKEAALRQVANLRSVGDAWLKPPADGKPGSLLPLLSLGFLWGAANFALEDTIYWITQVFVPQSEPPPEVLKRLLLMPVDILLYTYVILGFAEELAFRKGTFGLLRAALGKLGLTAKGWFWPAALASSVVFSAAHYVDWMAKLKAIGYVYADSAGFLAQPYPFTWAGFLARVAGGVMLAFLYSRSGILLLPIIAHFASNTLESMGLRWGLPYLLAGAGAIVLLNAVQSRRGQKPPAPSNESEKAGPGTAA